jgi:WD40 repeat protein
LTGHTGSVLWGAWGRVGDQAVLATGGAQPEVMLWNPESRQGRPLTGHTHSTWWGVWGRVGSQAVLATGGQDRTVMLWDPNTGRGLPLTGHTDSVRWGAWGRVGDRPVLATGGDDSIVIVWDSDFWRARPLTGHTDSVLWGAWGRIGDRAVLATGGEDYPVMLWIPGTEEARRLTGHTDRVRWGVWGWVSDRLVLATSGDDSKVMLWDLDTGQNRRFIAHTDWVRWGAWGRVGDRPVLATGGEESTVMLWDPDTGQERPLTGHTDRVRWGAWARVGDRAVLATGGDDSRVMLWDPDTGQGRPSSGHTDWMRWGAWSRIDERVVLATGGDDHTVRLWWLVRELPVSRVPRYRSDTGAGGDLLGRSVDAVALADVIISRSAQPPLAVGLFGQWGEGKSHFLQMLAEQVQQRAAAAGPNDPIAHGAVRQVRFNAWHYAETDLWASLVAELFAQLSNAPTKEAAAAEQRQQSRLTAELVTARRLQEQLVTADARLADLQAARAGRGWDALPEPARQQLTQLLGPAAERTYTQAHRRAAATRSAFRATVGTVKAMPRRWVVAVVLTAALGAVLLIWGPGVLRWLAALPGFGLLLGLWGGAVRGWKFYGESRERLRAAWQPIQQVLDAQARQLDTAIAVAKSEVDELRSRMQNLTAAGQLAGLVTDRAGAANYRQRLGLMTEIRQDFEQMARLLLEAAQEGNSAVDAAGDTLPRIDRIVIYIDDLDRCPPRRVVEVLEAVHLLLAAPLFVVVVAVDPRWLLRALASHYRKLFSRSAHAVRTTAIASEPAEEELWAATPAQYLEKIFQIVLTLAPMQENGYQRMINDLLPLRADAATRQADDDATGTATAGAGIASRPRASVDAEPHDAFEPPEWPLEAAPVVKRVDPLALTPDEHSLIGLLGPPLLTGPRAVKRLANSYGLLAAISVAEGQNPLTRQALRAVPDIEPGQLAYPYRAAVVLLGAVIGCPMLGPAFFQGLHQAARATPGCSTWQEFLAQLRASHEPSIGSDQWTSLLDALEHIAERAEGAGLPLPQDLRIWADWVVPVGRLSFPTGSAVAHLQR